jgi:hypothetical protein
MNGAALTFAVLSAVALLALPRRWAPLPLLAGTCYMTVGQRIELGPFTFTVLRILIAVGFLRIVLRRETFAGRWNALDSLILAFGGWTCVSAVFHQGGPPTLVEQLGVVYGIWGIYFLLRCFCSSLEDVRWLVRITALVLAPVAIEMVYEQVTLHNLFSVFGGVPSAPQMRDGRARAFGPFAHPILAGTVGGVTLPLMVGMWRYHRGAAALGIIACVTMVIASASSGPAASALIAIGALFMWRGRQYMRLMRWSMVAVYLALLVVMDRPPYYLIQRLEVFGGSTGWYRSRLIESAFEHLGEWWLVGTNFTRHWMPEATAISANHTDLTNHYLAVAVMGGLPLMILFIASLARGFSLVGRSLETAPSDSVPGPQRDREFMMWALGCSLAAHALTCISVSYFDQSFLFLYLTLAAIASASHTRLEPLVVRQPAALSPLIVRGRLSRAGHATALGSEMQPASGIATHWRAPGRRWSRANTVRDVREANGRRGPRG